MYTNKNLLLHATKYWGSLSCGPSWWWMNLWRWSPWKAGAVGFVLHHIGNHRSSAHCAHLLGGIWWFVERDLNSIFEFYQGLTCSSCGFTLISNTITVLFHQEPISYYTPKVANSNSNEGTYWCLSTLFAHHLPVNKLSMNLKGNFWWWRQIILEKGKALFKVIIHIFPLQLFMFFCFSQQKPNVVFSTEDTKDMVPSGNSIWWR